MDYGALIDIGAKLLDAGVTYGTATAAQKQALDAYAQAQKMIAEGQANFKNIATPQYKQITPERLGDTELKGIQNDPQGRLAEQQAYAELKKLSDSGGLSLGDQAALNEIQGNLNRNAMGRDKALQNSYAARGQLGGGAQLAMELSQGQNANERANQQGESIAAQAQARALAAIKERAGLGRQMSQDDYEKKAAAAKAADLIKERNAANSMQAQQQNNQWMNQGFANDLAKAQGQSGLIGQGVANILGTGNVNSNYTKAMGTLAGDTINGVAGGVKKGIGSGGDQSTATSPPPMVTADSTTSDPNAWSQWTGQGSSEGATLNDYDGQKLKEDDDQ